jgi:3-oxoacyl-[acyl-carrier protein] reductase
VGLSGTRVEPLQALAAELGGRAHVLPCDLSNAAAVEDLVKQAVEAMGSVDILVNNAGITRDALAMRMSDEDWLSVIEVNLTSTFRLCRAAIRPMMKARWGRIINVTSVVAQAGNPGQVNYAAAKAGVAGLSRSVAQEVASRGITVNCVAPGLVETAMTDKLNGEQRAKILTAVPVGRIGRPEEIAAGVVFLASVEAGYVTGATLDINGGGDML